MPDHCGWDEVSRALLQVPASPGGLKMKQEKISVTAAARAVPARTDRFEMFTIMLVILTVVSCLSLAIPAARHGQEVTMHAGYNLAYGAGSQALPSFNGQDNYLHMVSQNGTFKWDPDRFPLNVYIDRGDGTPGYKDAYRAMVARAFDEWSKGSGGLISWREVSSARGADVICTWTADAKMRGGGVEAGETRSVLEQNKRTGNGKVLVAKISILTQLMGRQFTDANMYKTCLHEVGHSLGLEGHSDIASDIMYPMVNDRQVAHLQSRDLNTILKLYGNNDLNTIARAPGLNTPNYGYNNPMQDTNNGQSYGQSRYDSGEDGLQPYTNDTSYNVAPQRPNYGRRHHRWHRFQQGYGFGGGYSGGGFPGSTGGGRPNYPGGGFPGFAPGGNYLN